MIDRQKVTEVLEQKIRNSGFRLTSSRKLILDIIISSKTELTAEEIFIYSHKRNDNIGIATVYRTVNLLEEFNLINKVPSSGNKTKCRYVNNSEIKSVGKTKIKRFPSTVPKMEEVHISQNNYMNGSDNFVNTDKIIRLQSQINQWNLELNKIKNEKEIDLEEMINDFSKLDRVLAKHQYSKNNLIQMLLDFQTEYNWLPKHILFYVGKKMDIPLSQVYSIASFYKYFNLVPKGKYQVVVCAGTACHVRGSVNLLQRIVNILKIKPGDTTPDYRFTLDTVNCLGCCALGPVMLFDKKYYSDPSIRQLEKLFDNAL